MRVFCSLKKSIDTIDTIIRYDSLILCDIFYNGGTQIDASMKSNDLETGTCGMRRLLEALLELINIRLGYNFWMFCISLYLFVRKNRLHSRYMRCILIVIP